MNILIDQIKFAFQKYPFRMWIASILFLVVFLFSMYIVWIYEKFSWGDPILGLFTFIMSIFIFMNQIRIDWESNLQKRITLFFELDGKTVMKFEKGLIPDSTDIRAWAQQIGGQMGRTRALKFEPSIEMANPKIYYDKIRKHYYKLFPVTFTLLEYPDLSEEKDLDEKNRIQEKFKNGNCMHWKIQYDERGKLHVKKDWYEIKSNSITA